MHYNGREVNFKAIKRCYEVKFINSDNRESSCYHPSKKVLTEHIEFLKSRGCHDFKPLTHDFVLYDTDNYIYPFPQSEVKRYQELLKEKLNNRP